jgi:sigma-B regulation protein RsbU (phosphoserine phosphatase)
MSGVTFEAFDTRLAPGDRLIILSDGVTECPNPEGEFLGEVGIDRLLRDLADVSGPELFESLMWKLCEFSGKAEFPDDISGIVFEFQPNRDDR